MPEIQTEIDRSSVPARFSRRLRHWLEWHPWRVILGLTAILYIFFLAAEAIGAVISGAAPALALSYLTTAVFLGFALLIILAACRVPARPLRELALSSVFLLGVIIFRPLLLGIALVMLNLYDQFGAIAGLLAEVPGLRVVGSVCVILCAAFFGRLVSRLIREANMLLIIAVLAAGIDLWGVYWGFVGEVTKHEGGRAIAEQLSASVPGIAAATEQNLPVLTAIGIGDFLFLALFFFVLRRFKMNQLATFWTTLAIMSVAPAFFLLGDILPIAENLPGLPFIALGTIIANWRYFKFSREEVRTLAVALVIVAAVVAAIIILRG